MSNRKTTLPTQTQLTGVAQTPGGEELSFKKTFWKWNGSDWNLKAKRGSCIANMYRKGVADKQVVFDPERTFDRRLCTGPWDSMGLLITRPKGMGRLIKAEQRRKDMAGERHRSSRKREWRACILFWIWPVASTIFRIITSLIFLNTTYLNQRTSHKIHYDTNKRPATCTVLLPARERNTSF